MTKIKKLALVLGVFALAYLALPQQSLAAIECSKGACYDGSYQFCCYPPLRCLTVPC